MCDNSLYIFTLLHLDDYSPPVLFVLHQDGRHVGTRRSINSKLKRRGAGDAGLNCLNCQHFSEIYTFYHFIVFDELAFYQKCSTKCIWKSLFLLKRKLGLTPGKNRTPSPELERQCSINKTKCTWQVGPIFWT